MPYVAGPARATHGARPFGPAKDERPETGPEDFPQETASPDKPQPAPDKEPVASPPPSQPQPPRSTGPGVFALLLGGVIAALLGFLVARYAVPEGWPTPEVPDPAIVERLDGLDESLAAANGRIDELNATIGELQSALSENDDSAALASLGEEIAALDSDIAALAEQVRSQQAAGTASISVPDEVAAAFEAELESFRSEMEGFRSDMGQIISRVEDEAAAARAAADAAQEDAERELAQARLQMSLSKVRTALDTGAPFSDALGELSGVAVPDTLRAVADDGVPTLAELQQSYPDAARAALSASDRGPGDGASVTGRLTAFLREQTNARSLEPREGDDADAVLSRAEAALGRGDLAGALAELNSLPEAARSALGEWATRAETRQAAISAADAIAAEIEAM